MASPAPGPTNLGMAPNLGGLLCYFPLCCIGFIFAVVVAIVEKQSRFLRFHAFQSLLVHAVAIVVGMGLWFFRVLLAMMGLGLLGTAVWGLQVLFGLAALGLMIFLMIKAYGNEEYELPTLGQMARKWA